MISYLAPDADISELELGGVEKLPSVLSLLQGMGYQQLFDHCEERSSSFDLAINDWKVVRASVYFGTARFAPQVWEPFADWISTTYPKDGVAMFDASYSNWRLTPKSIRLWRQHSPEYVDVVATTA